jgi:parallel beta-helix repeat protein
VITRPSSASIQNTINIEGSATWLNLRGLEIVGTGGGDGVTMTGTLSHITLEDLVIHDVDVGINFRSNMSNITVRRNHIYNTGVDGGTGEGMYVGCNYAACIVQNSLIEQNWIHDSLPGTTQGDGIEVKVGSHSNIIRDNVIYNRAYPGIFVYGTGTNPVNIVEGNVIWNAREGIYAVADAVVRNNIVFNSGTGLSLYPHEQVAQMKNVTAVNNTLYKNNDGILMRWNSSARNMILANNAIYSPTKNALNLSGSVGVFSANYVDGKSDRALDGVAFIAGGSSTAAFVDPGHNDFWPKIGSPLIAVANGDYAPTTDFTDFNATSRSSPYDVGAYENDGLPSNPGWRITTGFKEFAPPPDTTPPTVALTSPSSESSVSGRIVVSASASDDVGVAEVEFRLDGATLGTKDTSAPYSVSWDTTKSSNGPHTLQAIARDAAGNQAYSLVISVTVNNRKRHDPTN